MQKFIQRQVISRSTSGSCMLVPMTLSTSSPVVARAVSDSRIMSMSVVTGSLPRRAAIWATVLPTYDGSGSNCVIRRPSGAAISRSTSPAASRSSKSRSGKSTVRVDSQ